MQFRQWAGAPGKGLGVDGTESAVLVALDPQGEAGQVVFDGEFRDGAQAGTAHYEGRLVQDTGSFEGAAGVIMLVAFDVPVEMREEVDRWYEQEHVPLLMRAPGWLRARRYEVTAMGPGTRRFTSLAFHQLADVSVLESRERAFARSTEWRARLERGGTWFGQAGRWVYACR